MDIADTMGIFLICPGLKQSAQIALLGCKNKKPCFTFMSGTFTCESSGTLRHRKLLLTVPIGKDLGRQVAPRLIYVDAVQAFQCPFLGVLTATVNVEVATGSGQAVEV